MRLDKFLTECGIGSRKKVKEIIKNKQVVINNKIVSSPKEDINIENDEIIYDNKVLKYKKFRYYMLNKKAGYITAIEDSREKTVMDLLPNWVIKKNLVPVGRLDKDTEGLLLFTNNGKINHFLLSPKTHVKKTYYVELLNDIKEDEINNLEKGVDIGGYITMPSNVEKISNKIINITIEEGKFHQVKKMLKAVNNKVIYLKRISFGKLKLKDLELGEIREIELEDIIE